MFFEHYKLLSIIFSYPEDEKLITESSEKLGELSEELQKIDEFAEFITSSSLAEIQEVYVETFDLQPIIIPYISHHIFGESYRKGEYMVRLNEIYRQNSFVPSVNELPDHIAVVSEFLSILRENRNEFISTVMSGIKKMVENIEEKNTPYKQPVLLFYRLCSIEFSEFEEVIECSTC